MMDDRARPARELASVVLLASAFAGTPSRAGTPADEAWLALVAGHVEEAAQRAAEVLDREPLDARATVVRALALVRLDRAGEALAELREREPASSPAVAALGAGTVHRFLLQPDPADSLLTRAVGHFVESADRRGEAVAREVRGGMYWRTGRGETAETDLRAALALATSIGEETSVVFLRIELGTFLTAVGRYDEAEPLLVEAAAQARASRVPGWEGDAELSLGTLWRRKLDFERSLVHRWAAHDAYERAGDRAQQAESLHHIGAIHLRRGEYGAALRFLHRGLEMARGTGDTDEVAGILGDLGGLDYFLGDLDAAVRYWREALAIGSAAGRGPDWVRAIHSNVATALLERARYEEALEEFERALAVEGRDIKRSGEAATLNNLGRCLWRVGRVEEGVARLREAVDVARAAGEPHSQVLAFCDLAGAYLAAGDLDAASGALDEADALTRDSGSVQLETEILCGFALVARRRGEPERALERLRSAIEIAEGLRARSAGATTLQTGAFGTQSSIYEEAVDVLYEMHGSAPDAGWDAQAFDLAQRCKARAFLDLLGETGVDLRVRADPRYQRREEEILTKVAALSPTEAGSLEIEHLENELALLEIELREADSRYAELVYPEPVTREAARRELLEDGDVLLEYLLGDEASYAWVVTRESFRFVALPPRSEITGLVRGVLPMVADYNVLGDDPRYFVREIGELSRALLAPVAADLDGAKRLVVATHDVLAYLPFELLLRGETTESDWAALPFLVQSMDVVYVPSLSTWRRLARKGSRPARSRGPELLALGNPTLEGSNGSVFLRAARSGSPGVVPAADRELQTLRSLFPAERCLILEGASATLSELRRASATTSGLVHFATHGVFNENRPELSGLVLSPDPGKDDGFLSVDEVFGLELECDQVVLSACSTALGELITGEGIEGLTRAFLYAGAQTVVSTLWDVDGESTARFMGDFYRGLSPGTPSRSRSLADAKRAFLSSAVESPGGANPAHPYFWAAFVMSGDGG